MESDSTPQNNRAESLAVPREVETFLAGSERRIHRGMWVLGVAGVAAFWLWHGWWSAGGFAIGAALSALNYRWLHRAVAAVTDAALTNSGESPAARRSRAPGAVGSAVRIALRYALIAATGYVIFISSFFSLNAFFIGLFLFLGAVLIEAAYEILCGFRSA